MDKAPWHWDPGFMQKQIWHRTDENSIMIYVYATEFPIDYLPEP